MSRNWVSIVAAVCFAAASMAAQAQTQAYPTRPIRCIVPYAPGGSADTVARLLGPTMASSLGQSIVVDNRPGAGGRLGMQIAANSAPDGYTVIVGTVINMAIDPNVYKHLSYNPIRNFAPITQIDSTPNLLVIYPGVPAKTLKQFIAYAKANPSKVSFGSAGVGSIGDLTGDMLNQLAGIHMLHVPYSSGGKAVIAVMGGQIQAVFSGFSATLAHVKAGQLRAIAITSAKRSPVLPNVPTLAESGFPRLVATAWHGIFAPAGTPRPIVEKLYKAAVKALAVPMVRQRLKDLGFQIVGSSPHAFSAFIRSEIRKWARVVKSAGVKIS